MNSCQSGESLKCSWINLHFVLQKSFQNPCSAQKAKMIFLHFFYQILASLYLILFWPCNLDSVSRHLLELPSSKSRTRITCFWKQTPVFPQTLISLLHHNESSPYHALPAKKRQKNIFFFKHENRKNKTRVLLCKRLFSVWVWSEFDH